MVSIHNRDSPQQAVRVILLGRNSSTGGVLKRQGMAVVAAALMACVFAVPAGAVTAPAGWPAHVAVGLVDPAGNAAGLKTGAPVDARYIYLQGDAGTSGGWQ